MKRKTINFSEGLHDKVVEAAWEDGRIRIGEWAREALLFYLDTDPMERERFRAKLERENGDD